MVFSSEWHGMFPDSSAAQAVPKLGIDYVAASAKTASIGSLIVYQDLDGLGIAGVVWNCARILSEFLVQHADLVGQQRVVELGAGTGAVALSIAISCSPQSVSMTDLDDVVEKLTVRNVAQAVSEHSDLGGMAASGRLLTIAHRWGTQVPQQLVHCDVVICSDCLYEPKLYDDLQSTLLGTEACTVLIAYKQRHPQRERHFFESVAAHYDVEMWSDDAVPIQFLSERIFIVRCTRRRPEDHLDRPETVGEDDQNKPHQRSA